SPAPARLALQESFGDGTSPRQQRQELLLRSASTSKESVREHVLQRWSPLGGASDRSLNHCRTAARVSWDNICRRSQSTAFCPNRPCNQISVSAPKNSAPPLDAGKILRNTGRE